MSNSSAVLSGLLWLGAVGLMVAAAVVVLLYYRRRMNAQQNNTGEVFSSDVLLELRDDGKLTQYEFEALRQSAVDGMLSPSGDST